MKVFETEDRVNFVGDNNVFVGYANHSLCCENFGWFFTYTMPCFHKPVDARKADTIPASILEDYQFTLDAPIEIEESNDCGGALVFTLESSSKPTRNRTPLYLVLYNYHNGYYSHGWEHRVHAVPGKDVIKSGSL